MSVIEVHNSIVNHYWKCLRYHEIRHSSGSTSSKLFQASWLSFRAPHAAVVVRQQDLGPQRSRTSPRVDSSGSNSASREGALVAMALLSIVRLAPQFKFRAISISKSRNLIQIFKFPVSPKFSNSLGIWKFEKNGGGFKFSNSRKISENVWPTLSKKMTKFKNFAKF